MRVRKHRLLASWLALVATIVPAAAQSGPPLRVGVLTDLSGSFIDLVGENAVEAARMAAEDFGGVAANRKVEIIAGDTQNKPDIASGVARRWLDSEGVEVLVDVPVSSVALAVQAIARERKKVVLFSSALTDRLSNEDCSPWSVQWMLDTNVLAAGTVKSILQGGGDTWFFISADYAFGQSMERISRDIIEQNGGKFIGGVRNPFGALDMSSFLLQAQASKAKIIGIANAGQDFNSIVMSASQFGIVQDGQKLASLVVYDSDIRGLGLQTAQGLLMTTAFYWDLDDKARSFSERFLKRRGVTPNAIHASIYSSVAHYLKAVQAIGGTDSDKVIAWMRDNPPDDFFARNAKLRPDGLLEHDTFLMEVKKPEESRSKWDILKLVRRIPGSEAYSSSSASRCAYMKK